MTVVVSVLPRGQAYGMPALVALDDDSLEVTAYREFPKGEFLRSESTGRSSEIYHCRGLAIADDHLFAALFNAVAEYYVDDFSRLDLRFVRLWTAPAAQDLHGISLSRRRLLAASTGTDTVLMWDLDRGESRSIRVNGRPAGSADVRFPDQTRRPDQPTRVWRSPELNRLHLNDVTLLDDGRLVMSSLSRLWVSASLDAKPTAVVDDEQARMHDGRPLSPTSVLLTDAGRGDLVVLDVDSGELRRFRIADPEQWFVRGVHVAGPYAYVLSSAVTKSQQSRLPVRPSDRPRFGARFRVSIVQVADASVLLTREIALAGAPAGSVVYTIVRSGGG